MEIGRIGVWTGLAASIAAVALYVISLRGNRKVLLAARVAYGLTAFCVFFSFGRLMWLVVHKQFQYKYVFEYVSADLKPPFLYAATWAGQEGSFLLWAFWTAVIGGLIAWKAGKWESRVMPFFISTLCFLFAILAWLSPYNPMPRGGETGWPLDLPWPPPDGRGLNPSLQNYWMAIHPPTIFFGFASLAVPFSYAMAAMVWREYQAWAPRVMPYVLMTTATLGVGLFMGGYWAYETQGWHGFWGWDPVENASLFPFLGGLALLHGLVVQKSRGGMGRTTLFLSIAVWLLFLYGTFLTRSGALSGFSVHAFDMLGRSALSLLLVLIAVHGLGGLAMLIWRWRSIPGRPISDKALSRDTAMVLAVTLMIIGCLVVALGTSFPLFSKTGIAKLIPNAYLEPGKEVGGASLKPIFFNKVGSFLIIPALILMGVVPFLAWGKTNADKFLWKVIKPWFAAIAAGVLVLWFAVNQTGQSNIAGEPFPIDTPRTLVVAIGTLGAFAALANIALAWKVLRSKAVTMGGWLAHVGIGMLFIGTVLTNVYEKTDYTILMEGGGAKKTPFGYKLQYAGWSDTSLEKELDETTDPAIKDEKRRELAEGWKSFDHGVRIKVIPDTNPGVARADDAPSSAVADEPGTFIAQTPIFDNRQKLMDRSAPDTMRWPYIHKEWFRDFYMLVPNDPKRTRPKATIQPGETRRLNYIYNNEVLVEATSWAVEYDNFSMKGRPGQPGTRMVADLKLITPDGKTVPVQAALELTPDGLRGIPVQIPQANAAAILTGGIDPATRAINVEFEFPDAGQRWIIPVAVTNKPFINLVWLGVIIMGLGTLCAMVRRSLEARKGALLLSAAAAGAEDTQPAAAAIPPAASRNGSSTNGSSNTSTAKSRRAHASKTKTGHHR